MDATVSPQPPMGVGGPSTTISQPVDNNLATKTPLDYSKILQPNVLNNPLQIAKATVEPISMRQVAFVNGQPLVKFTEAEVDRMNIIENLQYAVVCEFSYGWPELEELRRIVPAQCSIKGECNIGLLRDRHLLIRLTLRQDFLDFTSKSVYYVKAKDGFEYQMRTLIYDSKIKAGEETSMVMAWISFPSLLPTYFVKECLFSLASAVGEPFQLDLATVKKTRPSCARVKVLVDLLSDLPNKVRMDIVNETTGNVRSEWVNIKYDYLPKYCKECKLQGHDMVECWRIHPELMDNKATDAGNVAVRHGDVNASQNNKNGPLMILSSGKVVGNVTGNGNEQWKEVRDNRNKSKAVVTNLKATLALKGAAQNAPNAFAMLATEDEGAGRLVHAVKPIKQQQQNVPSTSPTVGRTGRMSTSRNKMQVTEQQQNKAIMVNSQDGNTLTTQGFAQDIPNQAAIPTGDQQATAPTSGQKQIATTIQVMSDDERLYLESLLSAHAPQSVNLGIDLNLAAEDDPMFSLCRQRDISPSHIDPNHNLRASNKNWDDKVSEEGIVRRLPMRVAKQKQGAQTTSTRSNCSKNK